MAAEKSLVVPLNGSNYPTWKVQCKMALIKEDLWNIASGNETESNSSDVSKFNVRKNRALAIIVLAVDPSLLYLLHEPDDPIEVWSTLQGHFQKKTWANKLELRRKLFSCRLKEGESVQDHVKRMTEIFEELSVIGSPEENEDKVVYLLASLPKSFDMLVTALEANESVPDWDVVVERLLNEERKMKSDRTETAEKGLTVSKSQKPKCQECGKIGHTRSDCWQLHGRPDKDKRSKKYQNHKANKADGNHGDYGLNANASSLNCEHKSGEWIIDSGATCHMSNNKNNFVRLELLEESKITIGDGKLLKAEGRGEVKLEMILKGGNRTCTLRDVLYVPELAYSLLSVSRASKFGATSTFKNDDCRLKDDKGKLLGVANKVQGLYYLNGKSKNQSEINPTGTKMLEFYARIVFSCSSFRIPLKEPSFPPK